MAVELTAVFQAVPEGFIAFVEELPGANTPCATLEEARANLREAGRSRAARRMTWRLRFEWDPAKARLNERKPDVTFEEARTVFADDDAVLVADPGHSSSKDRFSLLGLRARLRVLVVVHCYKVDDEIVRLISARKATCSERSQYDARGKR